MRRAGWDALDEPLPWAVDPDADEVHISVAASGRFAQTEMRVMGCGAASAVARDGSAPSPPERDCTLRVMVERPGMLGYGPEVWIDERTTSLVLQPPSDLHVMTDAELDQLANLAEALEDMCRLTGCDPGVVEQAQHRYEESVEAVRGAR